MKKLYTTPSIELLEVQTNEFCAGETVSQSGDIINDGTKGFGGNYTEETWNF